MNLYVSLQHRSQHFCGRKRGSKLPFFRRIIILFNKHKTVLKVNVGNYSCLFIYALPPGVQNVNYLQMPSPEKRVLFPSLWRIREVRIVKHENKANSWTNLFVYIVMSRKANVLEKKEGRKVVRKKNYIFRFLESTSGCALIFRCSYHFPWHRKIFCSYSYLRIIVSKARTTNVWFVAMSCVTQKLTATAVYLRLQVQRNILLYIVLFSPGISKAMTFTGFEW